MRAFLLSVAIFMLAFIAVAPSGARTQTNEVKVYGYFFIAGKVPAAFKDIDVMDISIPGYVDSTKHGAPDYGRIRLKGRRGVDYLLLKPTLDGKNLSFKTKAVRGVSYEFSGTLNRTNFDEPQPGAEEIVLRGTLKKLQGRKEIAASQVTYTWELGD
jgi:hypothetical protein